MKYILMFLLVISGVFACSQNTELGEASAASSTADYTVPFTAFASTAPGVATEPPELEAQFSGGYHREAIVNGDLYIQAPANNTDVVLYYDVGPGMNDGLYVFKASVIWDGAAQGNNDGMLGFGFASVTTIGEPLLDQDSVEVFLSETDPNKISWQSQTYANGSYSQLTEGPNLRVSGLHETAAAVLKNGDDYTVYVGAEGGNWRRHQKLSYLGTEEFEALTVRLRNTTTAGGNKIVRLREVEYRADALLP